MQLEDGQWHSGLPQTREQHLALLYRVILHWISEIDLSDGNAQKLFSSRLGLQAFCSCCIYCTASLDTCTETVASSFFFFSPPPNTSNNTNDPCTTATGKVNAKLNLQVNRTICLKFFPVKLPKYNPLWKKGLYYVTRVTTIGCARIWFLQAKVIQYQCV